MRQAATSLLVLVLALGAVPARAWNTDDSGGWRAVYLGTRARSEMPPARFTGNEHTELSHLTLARLGLHDCFGIERADGASCTWRVVDLNSSLFRPQLMNEIGRGDDEDTPLEERFVPPPGHFAGLPDYSWSLYDWVNKNTLCPALPPSGDLLGCDCHAFAGWMGMYNANHFGSQARLMYERYHRIALALAERARLLRAALAQGPRPANTDEHRDYVREIEFEALIFEGIGQHFFQDRWSMGHMWERWNGADPRTAAGPDDSGQAAVASGLMHGHEGVSSVPDPLCSPVVGVDSATPVEWTSSGLGGPYPGVGDYRLEDVYDGFLFDTDIPLAVPTQRNQMIACLGRGWAEVVRAFGANPQGGFGAWQAPLDAPALPPILEDASCWDQWATNAAISTAWTEGSLVTALDTLLRGRLTLLAAAAPAPCEAFQSVRPILDWGSVTTRILLERIYDPGGAGLARGGIPPLGEAAQGGAYAAVPDYTEPEQLDALANALDALRGRDKQALFGFFNRAHADHWCRGLAERLDLLRGSADPVARAACSYLADRTYKGTKLEYRGRQRETRRLGTEDVDPICSFLAGPSPGLDERQHVYLEPGYVRNPNARAPHSTESVVAWCAGVPAIESGPCPGQIPADGTDDWDVVGRVASGGGDVVLRGRDFGAAPGEVRIDRIDTGPFASALSVVSWTDSEIAVFVPEGLGDGDWFVQVRRTAAPDSWSVGRFILRVGTAPCPPPAEVAGFWSLRGTSSNPETMYLLPDGSVMVGTPTQFTWAQASTWSVSGNTISMDPCGASGDYTYGGVAYRFRGTWSLHPVTDGFSVLSCFPPNEDLCPAMTGTLTAVYPDGTEIPLGTYDSRRSGSSRSWVPLSSFPQGDLTCRGGCRQTYRNFWPHRCAPVDDFACFFAGQPSCGGVCPAGFSCGASGAACRCLEDEAEACGPPAFACSAGKFCDQAAGRCVHF